MHIKDFWTLGLALSLVAGCKKAAPPAAADGGAGSATAVTAAKPDAGATAAAVDATAAAVDATAAPTVPPAIDAAAAAAKPEPFVAFEAMLLPLIGEPESEARSKKTCQGIEKLRIAGRAVQRSQPAGADAKAWEEASMEMRGAFE